MAIMLRLSDRQSAQLGDLPEELLDDIFWYLHPAPNNRVHSLAAIADLRNICAVSRKFRRIAEPILYCDICLPVFDSEKTYGISAKTSDTQDRLESAALFHRTISERPELAPYVKILSLARLGFKNYIAQGPAEYDWVGRPLFTYFPQRSQAAQHIGIPSIFDELLPKDPIARLRAERSNATVLRILYLLNPIETLHCANQPAGIPWSATLQNIQESNLSGPTAYFNVRRVEIDCMLIQLSALRPLLATTKLKHLVLRDLKIRHAMTENEKQLWDNVGPCSVETLVLERLSIYRGIADLQYNPLSKLSAIVVQLESLSVDVVDFEDIPRIFVIFEARMSTLRILQVTPSICSHSAKQDWRAVQIPRALCKLRSYKIMRALCLDTRSLTDMHTIEDFESNHPDIPLDSVCTWNEESFRAVIHTILCIPSSLESLRVVVCHESLPILTHTFIAGLRLLAADIETRAPKLSHITILWELRDSSPNVNILPPELISTLGEKGVTVKEEAQGFMKTVQRGVQIGKESLRRDTAHVWDLNNVPVDWIDAEVFG